MKGRIGETCETYIQKMIGFGFAAFKALTKGHNRPEGIKHYTIREMRDRLDALDDLDL